MQGRFPGSEKTGQGGKSAFLQARSQEPVLAALKKTEKKERTQRTMNSEEKSLL